MATGTSCSPAWSTGEYDCWRPSLSTSGSGLSAGIFSEGAPPALYAFLSHQSDSVVAQLCTVKARLTQRKPHDDFCGLLPIGRAPQIKLGNDAVESLQEKRNCFRTEASPFLQHALQRHARASQLWKGLQRRICAAARAFALRLSSSSPGPARRAWRGSSRSAPAADIRA